MIQEIKADVVVLGSGPGGYSAAFRAADLGKQVVLVERYSNIGGICLNVGCIPSKALLHATKIINDVKEVAACGVEFGEPKIDIEKLRGWKDKVVTKLTTGLKGLAKRRKVQIVHGIGSFLDSNKLEVLGDEKTIVNFTDAIIAVGSAPVALPFMPDDPRVLSSTGALALQDIPNEMLIIGGGIIGLEMATVYAGLGAKVTIVELLEQLAPGADNDLVKIWQRFARKNYQNILLETKVTAVDAKPDGLWVQFAGKNAPDTKQRFDKVLVAVGRKPNGKHIGAANAGVIVDEQGFIKVNKKLRTNINNIYAIGDVVGNPMLAHKAVFEGRLAAEIICGVTDKGFIDKIIPSVAYTDPEIAWVGITETEAKAQGVNYKLGAFPWAASGRSLSTGRTAGLTKLIFNATTHKLIGAGIVGTGAGELISELALAIEKECTAADIAHTIHPHPTLSETIMMAAEIFEGTVTDL